jgi:NAD(P)-dependent dehydrogenase (short-subunit alcohol dehydrogenase family)
MRELAGKVAVVTGAASGIGLAMSTRFAREGMKVVLADIEAAALTQAVTALRAEGFEVSGIVTDVSDPESVEALAQQTLSAYSKVHVLCSNAGVGSLSFEPLWRASINTWRWQLGVNLWGAIHLMHSFVQSMLDHGEEGHIVNTASVWGLVPAGQPYAVTKHALVAFSEALYNDLRIASAKIGVSVLCPGPVRTKLLLAERNRPDALLDEARSSAMNGLSFDDEGYLEPDQVVDVLVEAIAEKRFWILTGNEHDDVIGRRVEDILERRNPTQDARRAGEGR